MEDNMELSIRLTAPERKMAAMKTSWKYPLTRA
jgi:hypothetical protein